MGFSYEPRIAVIEFEGPFAGLEIRASLDLPARRQMRLVRQLAELQKLTETGDEAQADAALQQAAELFVTVTEGWNYEVGGEPLALTADNLLDVIPGNLFFQLTDRWSQTVRGVDAPLADESPSGDISTDSSTPTPETPSESPSS